jgi:Macrocin-O-methyltransferase (TylF)
MPEFDAEQVKSYRRSMALRSFEPGFSRAAEIPWVGDGKSETVSFHQAVGKIIGLSTPIRYLEFGVARGSAIEFMARQFSNPASEFVGFDSFEGLPEAWTLIGGTRFDAGTFSTGGALPKINDTRVHFVKGWFQNTLPTYLREHPLRDEKVTLIHYDADLYSSTLFILSSLWQVAHNYYFLFDEFRVDEVIALHDFASAFPVHIEFLARDPGPIRVLGRMRRVEFVLPK